MSLFRLKKPRFHAYVWPEHNPDPPPWLAQHSKFENGLYKPWGIEVVPGRDVFVMCEETRQLKVIDLEHFKDNYEPIT